MKYRIYPVETVFSIAQLAEAERKHLEAEKKLAEVETDHTETQRRLQLSNIQLQQKMKVP